jgi:cell division protein FtsQ
VIETPERRAAEVDPRTLHRARVRAVASAIASDVDPVRKFVPREAAELRGSSRRRRTAPQVTAATRKGRDRRRLLAALILLAEVALLAVLLAGPTFRIRGVTVTGTRLLTPTQVTAAARVGRGSVFTLDGDAVAARVRHLPWVQSVDVSVVLPGRVTISVTELTPMIRVVRAGSEYAVAPDGAELALSPAQISTLAAVPLLVDMRPPSLRSPITAQLIDALGRVAAELPQMLGVRVIAYEWDAQAQLSVWTSAGWRAVLGDLSLPGAVSAVPAQISALTALRSDLDFADPSRPHPGPRFGYVNLVDPEAPAVGGTPGVPSEVSAALGAASASA